MTVVVSGRDLTLPTGFVPAAGTNEAGLTYLSLAAQSLAVEARLLAAPPFLRMGRHVPDIAALADAVRRGELAIATPPTGDIDVDGS